MVICTLRLLNSDPRQHFPFVLIFSIKKPSLLLIKLKENIVATLLWSRTSSRKGGGDGLAGTLTGLGSGLADFFFVVVSVLSCSLTIKSSRS